MIRTLVLITGLLTAFTLPAATTTGTIAVQLVIYSRCNVQAVSSLERPVIDCGQHFSAQPRVTSEPYPGDAKSQITERLVTVEW